jgi:hypothetical protein
MHLKIQHFLLELPEEKRFVTMVVRDLFLAADSRITEAIKWNQLTFSAGKENLAFIYSYPGKDYMNLGFFRAVELADPKKMFEGTGNSMRHIKLYPDKNIPAAQIKKWIKQAMNL